MELKIKQFRKEKGFTTDKLSEKLHIGQSTLSQYENGKRDIGTDTLCKLADILNVSVDELLGREKKEPAVVQISPGAEENLSDSKKQLIEMIKDLSEDDTMIALGVIARLNNQPVSDIIKKIN